jgi:hypothetical protein
VETVLATLLLIASYNGNVRAYSVLAHEALIDAAWSGHLEPLIRARFPAATDAELDATRAYAS